MSDPNQIKNAIEQAVSRHLTEHLDRLRKEIVGQVVREIEPLLASSQVTAPSAAQSSPASDVLSAAIASIQESSVQADILKALLEGVSKFSARTALFVVRGTTLAGWQARGFSDDNIRGLNVDASMGLAARAVESRSRASAAAKEFDSAFVEKHGSPWDGNASVFPLVVKDKVAAILYCDSGRQTGHKNDYSAAEVLTRYACLWLEQSAIKKYTTGQAGAEPGAVSANSSPATASGGSVAPAAHASSVAVAEPALNNLPPEEQELHNKARRFARLLVDEIKLYNQGKVAEGKQNRALYKLLREDIEKSRATYDKRYGSTPVASARYFDSEVIRVLADNDRSLLGSDFPG